MGYFFRLLQANSCGIWDIFLGYYKLTVDSEKTTVASYNDSYCAVSFSINILRVSFSVYFKLPTLY